MCQQETSGWTLFDLYPKESTYRIISLKLNKFSRMSSRVYTALWAEDEMLTFEEGTTVPEELFHNLVYYHVPHGANNHGCDRSLEYFRRITYNKSDNYNSVDINSIYSNRDDRNLWNTPKRFSRGTFHNSPSSSWSQIVNFQQLGQKRARNLIKL